MSTASAQPIKRNAHLLLLAGEAPSAPGLRCTRCRSCGQHALGRVAACPACLGRDLEIVAAGQKATIVDASVVHNPAGGFEAPYMIATLCTAEGISLFAPLAGKPRGVASGTPLAFELIEYPDGSVGFAYAVRGD